MNFNILDKCQEIFLKYFFDKMEDEICWLDSQNTIEY